MKKIIALFAVVLTFLVLAGCNVAASSEGSYLSVEINPSVELILNKNDEVKFVSALNEDGEILLVDLNLVGLSVEEAMDLIIEEATKLGFIDPEEETTVEVTTVCQEEKIQEKLQTKAKEAVENAFAVRGMHGFANMNKMTPELITEAQELGISAGKLRLIRKAQELNPELTTEEAMEMKVRDLTDIIKEKGEQVKNMTQEMKQEFFQKRDEIRAEYGTQISDLKSQIADLESQIEEATDETVIADLQSQLDGLLEDLEEIHETIANRVKEMRQTYQNEINALKETRRTEKQNRINAHKEALDQFKNQFEENKDEIQEAIEEWQQQQGKGN